MATVSSHDETTGAEQYDQLALEVLDHLASGEFEYVKHWFGPDAEPPADELPDVWEQITTLFGEYEDAAVVADPPVPEMAEDVEASTVVHLRLELQGSTFGVAVGFEDGLVTAFGLGKADDRLVDKLSTTLTAGKVVARRAVGDGVALVRDRLPGTNTGPQTPEDRREAAVETVHRLADGEYEAIHNSLTPETKEMLPPEQIETAACSSDIRDGFEGIEKVEYDDEAATAYVTFETTDKRFLCTVPFGEYGRFKGLLLGPPDKGRLDEYEPPSYVDDDAFVEREFPVGVDRSLDGRLAVPRGVEQHPAAVIVHGSGASNMDGSTGANKPYRDLATGLATRGIATLRYHKRPLTDETLSPEDRVVGDAVDAVERLQADPAVDPDRVFVVGHSLGGSLAPKIAADAEAAGVVALAGANGDTLELLLDQVERLAERDRTDTSVEEAEEIVRRIRAGDVAADEQILGYPGGFWEFLRDYDVNAFVEDARPMLACHAGHDWKVADKEFENWQAVADETRRYPECNHLFIPVDEDEDVFDAGQTTGHPVESLVADVARFVKQA